MEGIGYLAQVGTGVLGLLRIRSGRLVSSRGVGESPSLLVLFSWGVSVRAPRCPRRTILEQRAHLLVSPYASRVHIPPHSHSRPHVPFVRHSCPAVRSCTRSRASSRVVPQIHYTRTHRAPLFIPSSIRAHSFSCQLLNSVTPCVCVEVWMWKS